MVLLCWEGSRHSLGDWAQDRHRLSVPTLIPDLVGFYKSLIINAEGVGFEPTVTSLPRSISSRVKQAIRDPLARTRSRN